MTEEIEKDPASSFKEQLFSRALSRYGMKQEGDKLSLPESMRSWFFGEEQVETPDFSSAGSGFFWQRLSQFVESSESQYYKFTIEPARLSSEIRAIAPDGKLLLFWLRVQFEAHQLLERPLAVAVGKEEVIRIEPTFLLDAQEHLTDDKIYFTQIELDKRLVAVKGALGTLLAEEIAQIQQTMALTLGEEMGRIREYYGHLLAKTSKFDEKDRLRREQKTLEQEHVRRLHPASLKIITIPELIVSLQF